MNEHLDESRPAPGFLRHFLLALSVAVLLGSHVYWVQRYVTTTANTGAQAAHLSSARQFARTGSVAMVASSPIEHVGSSLVWTDAEMALHRAGPGVAWCLSPFEWFGRTFEADLGRMQNGGNLAMAHSGLLFTTLTLLFVFLLVRRLAPGFVAWIATAVVATLPFVNDAALVVDGVAMSMTFLVGGFWALDAWSRRPGVGRALLAGLLLGMAPTIRPLDGGVMVGVLLFVVFTAIHGRVPFGHLFVILLGAAVPLTALGWHNQEAYGAAWIIADRVAAGMTFDWSSAGLLQAVRHHCDQPAGLALTVLLAGGLVLMLLAGWSRRTMVLLGMFGATLAIVVLHLGHRERPDTLSGFVPLLPLAVVAGAAVFGALARRSPWLGGLGASVVGLVLVGASVLVSTDWMSQRQQVNCVGESLVAQLQATLPARGVIVAEPAMLDVLAAAGHWPLGDASLFLAEGGRVAVPTPIEAVASGTKAEPADAVVLRLQRRDRSDYARMEAVARRARLIEELAIWSHPGRVHLVLSASMAERWASRVQGIELVQVGSVALPVIATPRHLPLAARMPCYAGDCPTRSVPAGDTVGIYEWRPGP